MDRNEEDTEEEQMTYRLEGPASPRTKMVSPAEEEEEEEGSGTEAMTAVVFVPPPSRQR